MGPPGGPGEVGTPGVPGDRGYPGAAVSLPCSFNIFVQNGKKVCR